LFAAFARAEADTEMLAVELEDVTAEKEDLVFTTPMVFSRTTAS
jgi:hypothetical protein